jgi:tRNA U55 pseudouridine synthase TruB
MNNYELKSLVELKSLKSNLEFQIRTKIYTESQIDKIDEEFNLGKENKELLRLKLDTMARMDMITINDFDEILALVKYNRNIEQLQLQNELIDLNRLISEVTNELW